MKLCTKDCTTASVLFHIVNLILDTNSTITNTSGIPLADQKLFVLNNIREVSSFQVVVYLIRDENTVINIEIIYMYFK